MGSPSRAFLRGEESASRQSPVLQAEASAEPPARWARPFHHRPPRLTAAGRRGHAGPLLTLVVFAALAVVCAFSLAVPALAKPLIPCDPAARQEISEGKPSQFCVDADLVGLDAEIDRGFDKAIRTTKDPLLAGLLHEEERLRHTVPQLRDFDDPWLIDIYPGGVGLIRDSLARQKAVLAALAAPNPDGLAGAWANAQASIRIEATGPDTYRMIVHRRWTADLPDPSLEDIAISTCDVSADLARRPDGWFTAPGDAAAPLDGRRTALRRQGSTLRVILARDTALKNCGPQDAVTGTYFRTAVAAEIGPVHTEPVIRPSFACGPAETGVGAVTCADPELADLDRHLTTAYADALKRLDAETAAHLREDQRVWLRFRAELYDDSLSPISTKQGRPKNDFGAGRATLRAWLRERIAMLEAITPRAPSAEGAWMSARSRASVKRTGSGNLVFTGFKESFFYHGGSCDFGTTLTAAAGRIVAEPTQSAEGERDTPAIWSDGRTLTVDAGLDAAVEAAFRKDDIADYRKLRPSYCTRRLASEDRLFPLAREVPDTSKDLAGFQH